MCTVEIDPIDKNQTAFQRFLPNGDVVAMLPCAANQMSIVWSCDKNKAQSLEKLESDILVDKINEAFKKVARLR